MPTPKLRNISLADFRKFLQGQGCRLDRTEGGHEMWVKKGATRPNTIQTHIDPVPERIVKNSLEILGVERKDFDLHSSGAKK
jgi:hypothetical protein